ncbi:MAG: amidohydrolase family protein [Candidatus Eutrophobiaceae bacterium]
MDNSKCPKVIDWHAHVAGIGHGGSGAFVNQRMRKNWRFRLFLKWMGATLDELAEHGDQLIVQRLAKQVRDSRSVDAAVVLAMDGVINPATGEIDREKSQLHVPNEYVLRETAKYPELLYGASVNPMRPDAIERLEEAHHQGAYLIKWLPSIMHIDPSDKTHIPFYEKLAELGTPLLTHAGAERAFPCTDDCLCDPRNLELPLQCGVTVIAAHLATTGKSNGEDNFKRMLPMFREYPNLYTDISSLTQINKIGYLAQALKLADVTERMLYGTDWPLQHWPLTSAYYHLRQIGVAAAVRVQRERNVWDRDVLLKRAIGVPQEVFYRRPPGDREIALGKS